MAVKTEADHVEVDLNCELELFTMVTILWDVISDIIRS